MVDQLVSALGKYRYLVGSEADLQNGVEIALKGAGVTFERERVLGRDRVDFFAQGVAIELKVDGSLSDVTRQIHRYAQHPEVTAVLLVTTRVLHDRMPATMCEKPVRVLRVAGRTI